MQGPGFDSWVGKTPWRRKWQPTLVFLPVKSPRQRTEDRGAWQAIVHGVTTVKHNLVTKQQQQYKCAGLERIVGIH